MSRFHPFAKLQVQAMGIATWPFLGRHAPLKFGGFSFGMNGDDDDGLDWGTVHVDPLCRRDIFNFWGLSFLSALLLGES